MESLTKLKNADEKFKRLIFARDLTKTEREEIKHMVAEAKDLQDKDVSGEYIYQVRGAPGSYRIVKFRRQ